LLLLEAGGGERRRRGEARLHQERVLLVDAEGVAAQIEEVPLAEAVQEDRRDRLVPAAPLPLVVLHEGRVGGPGEVPAPAPARVEPELALRLDGAAEVAVAVGV